MKRSKQDKKELLLRPKSKSDYKKLSGERGWLKLK